MVDIRRRRVAPSRLRSWSIIFVVLVTAFYLGGHASVRSVLSLAVAMSGLVLLLYPALGPMALVGAALFLPLEIGTGTEVKLNVVTLLVPFLLGVWLLGRVHHRDVRFSSSPLSRPLALLLLAGLLSLLIGRATWDPTVPVTDSFVLVQLAQWAIFAFSAGAFWLSANLVRDEEWLWRLTSAFMLLAGGAAILKVLPGMSGLVDRFTTIAFIRPPLWVLLTALAGGQLLFNRNLSWAWRLFLVAILGAALAFSFVQQQDSASNWLGIAVALGTLAWLRYPRLRWPATVLIMVLTIAGVLLPTVYRFAGGDAEWTLSGGSRMVLIERVIDVSMRNPITGLGPAAYRRYAAMEPLQYGHAFWIMPSVSSHNNYVDLFSQVGLLGLAFFLWFCVEVAHLGYNLHRRFRTGFKAAYVNAILAAGVGGLVIMLLADWILPFVYNIGFPGFQASVLVWLFLGGLVAIDKLPASGE